MKKLVQLTICLAAFLCATAKSNNGAWLSEEVCQTAFSQGEDFITENYKNGGTPFFYSLQKRDHVIDQLNFFNDTFDTELRVYCGRYFLNYSQYFTWDTALFSIISPELRTAYSAYTQGVAGDRTSANALQLFYPTYQQYLDQGGQRMLLVYLECHFYVNNDTHNVVSTTKVLGLLSRGVTNSDDKLRIEYLKSTSVAAQLNAFEAGEDKIVSFIDKIVNEFSSPVSILNANCPDCPLHPDVGQNYWDNCGRLWRWMEGADHNLKWMDLSYEFPEEGQGYDLSWKPAIPNAVQLYHEQLYIDKITLLRNDPLQQALGGVPAALEKEIWRATQFAAVNGLKEAHINQHIALWENFVPVWGNARHAYYDFQVANGQLTYQFAGCVGIVMTGLDVILCEGFIQNGMMGALRSPINFVQNGISFVNNVGSRIIVYGQQSVVRLSLILALKRAPQIAGEFFVNRGLPRAIEIFDQGANRYIKHNPETGQTIVAKYTENLNGTTSLEFERELNIQNQNWATEQSIADNVVQLVDNFEESLINTFVNETGVAATAGTDDALLSSVRSWQGSGLYPGIDDWVIIEVPAGTKMLGGLPGQSSFYAAENALTNAGGNKSQFWQSLQVMENSQYGYRPKVGVYTTNSPIKVAMSKTLANPQFGSGGAWQFYVDDFANKLTLSHEIILQ